MLKPASTCQKVPPAGAKLCWLGSARGLPSFSGVGDPGLEAALGNIRLVSLCVAPSEGELTSAWPALNAANHEAAGE